jgi:hypothetical protein
MKVRQNWKRMAIEELQARYGMSENMAEIMWRRAYKKALRLMRKNATTKDLNVTFELYASIFNRGVQLFKINFDDLTPKVEIAKEFQNVENLEKAFILKRFEHMAQKYSQVAKWLDMYRRGKMSYEQLKDKIKKFKDTNREYLKSGS